MWKEYWNLYYKRIIGVVAGLFFGFIYLFFGFWDMCFVILLVALGYWIGKEKEYSDSPLSLNHLYELIKKLFRPYR